MGDALSIEDTLKVEEGWLAHVYPDSLGFATIGYGFLVDSRRGAGLPKVVADSWLDYLVKEVRRELDQKLPWLQSQPNDVQDALVLIGYQLGVSGVLGFSQMLASLQIGDREGAATHALDSKWATQTPDRAKRVAAMIRGDHGTTS